MGVKGSVYLNNNSRVKSNAKTNKGFLVVFVMALLTLFLGAQNSAIGLISPGNNSSSQTASAGPLGFLCGGPDDVVDGKPQAWNNIDRYYPVSAATNRKWTLDEAYGAGLKYPIYTGEGGESTFLVTEATKDRGKGVGNYDESLDKLKSVRVAHTCLIGGLGVELLGNMPLMAGRVAMTLLSGLTTIVFDSSIICKSPSEKSQGNCVNLLATIGGTSDEDTHGIIQRLTKGVYLPLATLIVLAAAMYVAWVGIVKRKLREAFGAAIWVFLSFILGLTFLYKPMLLAKAPMALSNNISACIMGGYAGHSCTGDGDGGTTVATTEDKGNSDRVVCLSKGNTSSADQEMSLIMNTMTCRLWKAFVLEPYSEGSFGRNFEDLDVANPETKKQIEKAKLKPEDFCVALTSSKSVDQQGSILEMDSAADKICNVAAYQMFLQTGAKDTSGAGTTYNGTATPAAATDDKKDDTKEDAKDEAKTDDKKDDATAADTSNVNKDWYKVVLFAAADDGMWSNWTPGESEAFHKMFVSFISIFTIIAGGIVIASIAGFAFIFYLTSIFLMAFAPLFLLLGIHPGRGKAILLGWAETVLENVFKYIASAMFLVVTVAIYDAVLSDLKNLGLTFLFILLLSLALFYYRKEIVNLIGKVNMGGKRMANKFEEKVAPRLKRAVNATAGGAVGAAWSDGLSASNFMHGAKQGMKRDIMRDRKSFLGAAMGERERMMTDNKQDLKSHATAYQTKATNLAEERKEVMAEEETAKNRVLTDEDDMSNARDGVNNTTSKIEAQNSAKAEVLLNAKGLDETFRKMQALTNELATLALQRQMAMAVGDMAEVDRIDARSVDLASERDQMLAAMDRDDLDRNLGVYENELRLEMAARGIDDADMGVEFANAANKYAIARDRYMDDLDMLNAVEGRRIELDHQIGVNTRIAKQLNTDHRDLKAGEKLSAQDVRDLVAKAENDHINNNREFFKGNEVSKLALNGLPMLNNLYDDEYMKRLEKARETEQNQPKPPPIDPISIKGMASVTRINQSVDLDPFINATLPDGVSVDDYSVGIIDPGTGRWIDSLDIDEGTFSINPDNTINFTPTADFTGQTPTIDFGVQSKIDEKEVDFAPMKVTVTDPSNPTPPDRPDYNLGEKINLRDQGTYTKMNQPVDLDPFINSDIEEGIRVEDLSVKLHDPSGEAFETLALEEGVFQVNDDNSVTFTPAQDYVGPTPSVDVTASTVDGEDVGGAQLKVVVSDRDFTNPNKGGNGPDGPSNPNGPGGSGDGPDGPPPGGGGSGGGPDGPPPGGGGSDTGPTPNTGSGIPIPPSNPEQTRAGQGQGAQDPVVTTTTPDPSAVTQPVQQTVTKQTPTPQTDPAPEPPSQTKTEQAAKAEPVAKTEPVAKVEPAKVEPAKTTPKPQADPKPAPKGPAPKVEQVVKAAATPTTATTTGATQGASPFKTGGATPAAAAAATTTTQETAQPTKIETAEPAKNWGFVDGTAAVKQESRVKKAQPTTEYIANPRPKNIVLGNSGAGEASTTPTPKKRDVANAFDFGDDS